MLIRALTGALSRPWRRWLFLAALFAVPGFAQEAPRVSARSAIVLDATSGEILYAKDPHALLPPASTTKVLTALIALERLAPGDWLPVSPQAAAAAPSRVGLRAGERAPVEDLLHGLLLKSGNDAAEVLAEAVGGSVSGFARLMNARARQLGALNSHFANPHGLPDASHISTAYDLAVIFRYAMLNPAFTRIVQMKKATVRIETGNRARAVPIASHNRLLGSYEGMLGGKTGFTNAARRCYVGEAERGGRRVVIAMLGSNAMWEDSRKLLDFGFARYGLAASPAPAAVKTALPAARPAAKPRTTKASTRKAVAPAKKKPNTAASAGKARKTVDTRKPSGGKRPG